MEVASSAPQAQVVVDLNEVVRKAVREELEQNEQRGAGAEILLAFVKGAAWMAGIALVAHLVKTYGGDDVQAAPSSWARRDG